MIRQVQDVALQTPVMVQPETTILVAEQQLIAGHASVLYVVDESEILLGQVLDQEILNYRLMGGDGRAQIASLMTPISQVLEGSDPLERGVELLKGLAGTNLPVVQQGRLIGQLSRRDLLRLLAETKVNIGTDLLPNLEPNLLALPISRNMQGGWKPEVNLRGVG